MPTILKIIVYPIFAFFCLLFFMIVLFPYDSLKARVAQALEQGVGGGYSISIGKLSPAPLTGLSLRNVTVQPLTGGPEVKISRLKLKFGILALLRHTVDVDFDLRAGEGRASGSWQEVGGGTVMDFDFKKFDLATVPFLMESVKLPLSGQVGGTFSLELYPDDPLRNIGKINLTVNQLEVKESTLGGLPVPKIQLAGPAAEKSRIEITVSKGNWEVAALKLVGGEIECDSQGKVYGARNVQNYRFNLKGGLKISPDLIAKLPILSAIEKQKGPDGIYPLLVTGRFAQPAIRIGEFKVPI